MSDSAKVFPHSAVEAIAFLWLQQQDLKGKSPKEIYDMFWAAVAAIR